MMALTQLEQVQLFIEAKGEGIPILMFHGGLGLDHTYLTPYFDTLTDHYSVIYFDHRGNGRSQKPTDYAQLNFEVLCNDADAVRQHLEHEKVIAIGHSYGGFIAQEYAVRFQEHLLGMVLIDTVPALDYQPQPTRGNDEQLAALSAAFTRPMESDEDWQQTWSTLIQIYFTNYDPAVGKALDAATHYSCHAWNRANAMLAEYSTLATLPSLTIPTLVVSGRHDFVTPPDHGTERLARLIPNASMHIFENSAHYPFIEEQESFFNVLRDWLKQFD
ncbi:MAG: alpha/beta fold hydrolase [Chloroflexota bacterium]